MDNRDERTTLFSRMFELKPGTPRYRKFYKEFPQWEQTDKELRDHPPGEFSHRRFEQNLVDGVFSLLADLRPLSGQGGSEENPGPPASAPPNPILLPGEWSRRIKQTAAAYGAVLCGITPTEESFRYTIRGRGRHYGSKTASPLPWTIVFAVEMSEGEIAKAPGAEESMEVVKGYLNAAVVGLVLRSLLVRSGYEGVVHMDGESELILPPAAEAAGLGGLGLSGLLVTKEFGPRVRLGAVTTNLPLTADAGKPFRVDRFCRTCGRCADRCPAAAIPPYGERKKDGPFGIDHERCFRQWRRFGTDCGLCLEACPFSHPKN